MDKGDLELQQPQPASEQEMERAMNARVPDDSTAQRERLYGRDVCNAAQRLYAAFSRTALGDSFPLITGQLAWGNLPEWYKDLLTASMDLFLSGEKLR